MRGPRSLVETLALPFALFALTYLAVGLASGCGHTFNELVAVPDEPAWDCDVICEVAVPIATAADNIDAHACRCYAGSTGFGPFKGFGISMSEDGEAVCFPNVHAVAESLRAAEKAKAESGHALAKAMARRFVRLPKRVPQP